jgi:hypothetical protein
MPGTFTPEEAAGCLMQVHIYTYIQTYIHTYPMQGCCAVCSLTSSHDGAQAAVAEGAVGVVVKAMLVHQESSEIQVNPRHDACVLQFCLLHTHTHTHTHTCMKMTHGYLLYAYVHPSLGDFMHVYHVYGVAVASTWFDDPMTTWCTCHRNEYAPWRVP